MHSDNYSMHSYLCQYLRLHQAISLQPDADALNEHDTEHCATTVLKVLCV